MAFSLKLSYSKVRASFTHLGRGSLVDVTPRAIFRILSVTCLLTRKARLSHVLKNDERFCTSTVYIIYTYVRASAKE